MSPTSWLSPSSVPSAVTTAPPPPVAGPAGPVAPERPGAGHRAHPSRARARRRGLLARQAAAALSGLVILAPLYWMVVVAFSPRSELLTQELRLWPRAFTLANFETVFETFPVATWFQNSVAIALVVTAIAVTVNLLAGYALAHLRFPGSDLTLLLVLATLMVPVQVIMVSQFQLITDLGLYGTYWAVILPSAATAFGVFLARQFMLAIPRELVEAARIDGAGALRIFTRVVLPLCGPLVAVLSLLTFLMTWNDFAWPLIALGDTRLFTLPIGMLFLQGQFGSDYGAIMAFALMAVLPMVVLFLVCQRWFVQGFARSGIR